MRNGDGDGFEGNKEWDTDDKLKASMDAAAAAGPAVTGDGERKWDLRTWAELEQDPRPVEWVVEDYIERGTFCVAYGPPGSCKSFVAIDLAACIATGQEWHGNPVEKGLVLYCGGEGPQAFSRRLRAWRLGNKIDGRGSPFVYLANRIGLAEESQAISLANVLDHLQQEHGEQLAAVVVDTWQRHLGGDENSTAEVSLACEHLMTHFRDRFNASVVVLHHTGWGDTVRLRGSRVLQAECDALYQVNLDKDNDRTSMVCERMRDGAVPGDLLFHGEEVNLAANGAKEEKSWYLKLMPGAKISTSEKALGDKERAVLSVIRKVQRGEEQRMEAAGMHPASAEITPTMLKEALAQAQLYTLDAKGIRSAWNVVSRLKAKKLVLTAGKTNIRPADLS